MGALFEIGKTYTMRRGNMRYRFEAVERFTDGNVLFEDIDGCFAYVGEGPFVGRVIRKSYGEVAELSDGRGRSARIICM